MKIQIDNHITALIDRALEEDLLGGVDVTSVATIDDKRVGRANFLAKAEGIIAGLDIAQAVMKRSGVTVFQREVEEGARVSAGTIIATAQGPLRSILLAERTALNLISRLSGIATLTRRWVDAVSGTKVKIRDTRKTTPGLRTLEKYAVRVGGGINHRSSLSEAALLKDNHIAAAGSISAAFHAIQTKFPSIEVEVEVDTLAQLEEALRVGVKTILLDNMNLAMTKEAVEINRGQAKLESSGGITLEQARSYAETGVDFLAIGALTHSAPILDISLEVLTPYAPDEGM